jgi:hypothetical protein
MLYAGRNKQMAEPERIEANWIADVRADESTMSGLLAVFNSRKKGNYVIGISKFKSNDDTVGIYLECPTGNPTRFSQPIKAS